MSFAGDETNRYPPPRRRLRLGFVGGGRGSLIGPVHAAGARLSNRWEAVAGALSSDPAVAQASGQDWMLAPDRVYSDYRVMAEREVARPDGIEAVVISTPNHLHRDATEAFLRVGIDVICDKPLATSLADAQDMVRLQRESGLVLGVTYPFTSHAMVRQAREMVRAGALGRIRQVHAEFIQDWASGHADPDFKGAAWRRDPARMGRASATGDIGTHAYHLVDFVTGLEMTHLRADFHICGAPKAMEDTAFLHVRFAGEVPGTLWVTQTAPGNYCALRLRVFGEAAGLEWDQEFPELLKYRRHGEPEQILVRGHGAGMHPAAERLVRMPRGHGEALTDAWANLYTELAIAIEARRSGATLPEGLLAYPTVVDGAKGVCFIEAAADSHEAGGTWTECRWNDA
ncbi:MAG TPA: Gfo/Idh/MocA family oxidoreductase [Acetobacteraceae bacterium]|nr:Gfo/Idh/MocA family oxidoreductase [Acetobacteraceae bacterium]